MFLAASLHYLTTTFMCSNVDNLSMWLYLFITVTTRVSWYQKQLDTLTPTVRLVFRGWHYCTDLCSCGETQTMSHIVESCPLPWMVVCPSSTLLMMLLLPGWPTMGLNRIRKKKKTTALRQLIDYSWLCINVYSTCWHLDEFLVTTCILHCEADVLPNDVLPSSARVCHRSSPHRSFSQSASLKVTLKTGLYLFLFLKRTKKG